MNTTADEGERDINPHLMEQNEGIFEAFALEEHTVLTTSEITEHLSLSRRQVQRRLENLVDEEIVGTRKPGGDRLWWLEEEVPEPYRVSYPIYGLIQDRISLQFILLGGLLGLVTVFLATAAVILFAYDLSWWIFSTENVFQAVLISSMSAVLFILIGGAIIGTVWLFSHLGIEIRYKSNG